MSLTAWKIARCSLVCLPAIWIATGPVAAQEVTAPAQVMLEELGLSADILEGLDQELAVPQEWVEAAAAEGPVKVRLTMEETHFTKVAELFNARYPDIELEYFRGTGPQRAVQPLMSFKRGTYIADLISSFETLEQEFRDADALVDLTVLPTWNSIRPEFHSEHGVATAWRLQHYCLGYDATKVDKADLPKTWEEFVEDPRWQNGNVGMARNYNVWLAEIWGVKGDAWGNAYVEKIFNDLKPQYRKENLSTLPKLASLGEFLISVPTGDAQIADLEAQGVPVGYHCPEPVPVYMAWIGVLKGGPHVNGALVFSNWLLSVEGQLSVWWADNLVPSHKKLARREFMAYPDEVLGKQTAPLSPKVLALMPQLAEMWSSRWIDAGGPQD